MISHNVVSKTLIVISLLLFSCSSQTKTSNHGSSVHYLNPKYADHKITDVSLGIVFQDFKLDTINIEDKDPEFIRRYFFAKDFLEQLPKGIVLFSNFSKVDWIYFDYQIDQEPIENKFIIEDGKEVYVYLPYTIETLSIQNNYDYLMFFQSISISEIEPFKDDKNPKYKTKITAQYQIWDNKTLDLMATNEVEVKSEFDKMPERWPYKNVLIKFSALIIDDLPMFKK